MSRTHLWVSAGIIALLIIIAFALSVPHTHDVGTIKVATVATSTPVVAIRDVYKKGQHTITGSITVPDACIPVAASATLVGNASSTENILLALTFQPDSSMCLEVPTVVTFQANLPAPSSVPLIVTVNGAVASTTHL